MTVVELPELKQIGPWALIVVLGADPVLLRISRKDQELDFLSPDESMVIVDSRIQQMSDDLLNRPFPRGRFPLGLLWG